MPLPAAIRDSIERCTNLPTLPAVAIRVLELCQQDQLDLNQIAGVIANDPALSVKLMKTANSPIFALRREVTSIPYAVSLLGINAVRTLVLSFSFSKVCQHGNRAGLGDYWRRSLLSALAAREMCQGPFVGMREEAFLCGLLQDIGMLAMAQALGQAYAKLLDTARGNHDKLTELERLRFGGDHAEVGKWLLEKWRVPAILSQVVGASHTQGGGKDSAGGDPDLRLAGIVALSGRFADLWTGDPKLAPARLIEQVAKTRETGVPVDIDRVNASLLQHAPQIAPLFDVKLDAGDMAATLEQAHEILLALSVRASQELTGIHQALARLESRTATLLAETQQDRLTGLANRSHTAAYLEEVFAAAVSSNRLIGAIFADIDFFKRINDSHGHGAGDLLLQSVAQTIQGGVRGGDFVGRWGGEEFVIIMRAEGMADLAVVAERIRRNVAETPHLIGGGRAISATISLGCAMLDAVRHRRPADLIEEADRAMYEAKRGGRNQYRMNLCAA
jgi:diguanylate cyclase (GGDEF)-like protein